MKIKAKNGLAVPLPLSSRTLEGELVVDDNSQEAHYWRRRLAKGDVELVVEIAQKKADK